MTGTGPVEPDFPPAPDGPHPHPAPGDAIGVNSPHLSGRWASPPVPHRRIRQVLLAALATAAALALPRPTPAASTLGPPPSQVTSPRYDGPGTTGDGRSSTFLFTVSVRGHTPVTIQRIGADLPGLATRTTPSPPLTVKAGRPRCLVVRSSVRDCPALPHGVNIPRLDLSCAPHKHSSRTASSSAAAVHAASPGRRTPRAPHREVTLCNLHAIQGMAVAPPCQRPLRYPARTRRSRRKITWSP
ncbi:hypothetical protein ACWGDT_26870 [Streptomyces avermitilis]